MELYVSEFSKYVITLLIALYTYESFAVFRKKHESDRNGIYTRQNILMFGLHFSCFIAVSYTHLDQKGHLNYLTATDSSSDSTAADGSDSTDETSDTGTEDTAEE